ncbi:MAG: FkbM family methyltransferase [Pseudomonadota bacterium]
MTDQQRALQIFKTLRDRRVHLRELRGEKREEEAPPSAPVDPDPGVKSLEGFYAFAWPQLLESHSQVFQDLWVLYEMDGLKEGYFIEFGVANGTTLSNSFNLERRHGWTGIISEPNPTFHENIQRARSCQFTKKAIYSTTGLNLTFSCAERPMFSRLEAPGVETTAAHEIEVADSFDVETISLNDAMDEFDAPDVVDYVSVDTEGTEQDIIEAFDFGKRLVRAFTIEHNYTDMREKIFDLMSAHGYHRRFPEISRFDDCYIHESVLTGG